MKKTYGAGLGVVVLMSAKGTATLAATFLLPTWPARIFALAVVLALGGFAFIRYRRRKRALPE